MYRFANVYLVVFVVDALLSLVDDWALGGGFGALHALRDSIASFTLVSSFPMFWLMAFWPQLPKSVFLPPTLLCLWSVLGAMPLPIYFGFEQSGAILCFVQIAVAGFMLLRTRALTGGRVSFDAPSLPDPGFRPGHAIAFVLTCFTVGPMLLAVYVVLSAAGALDVATGGFVRLRPDGVYVQERQYERGSQRVHLLAMIHIGDRSFYEELFASLPSGDAIVLNEGVTDRQGLFKTVVSYKALASLLNLESQEATPTPKLGEGHEMIYADVDVSEFSPETIAYLNEVFEILAHDSFDAMLQAALDYETDADPHEIYERFNHDVLVLRNEHALEVLGEQLERYPVAVLPWGATHMPGLEAGLKERGFELAWTQERRIIEF